MDDITIPWLNFYTNERIKFLCAKFASLPLMYKYLCESKVWGFESPSGREIFCLKSFDTFTRTPVRESKMNAVDRAQLTFQMLTLLQKYLHRQSQY